jgi:hypothetical protein
MISDFTKAWFLALLIVANGLVAGLDRDSAAMKAGR